jgi:hypothetical protein
MKTNEITDSFWSVRATWIICDFCSIFHQYVCYRTSMILIIFVFCLLSIHIVWEMRKNWVVSSITDYKTHNCSFVLFYQVLHPSRQVKGRTPNDCGHNWRGEIKKYTHLFSFYLLIIHLIKTVNILSKSP